MKTPGIVDGVVVALVISLGAAVASLLLGGFIGYGTLFNAVLLAATLTYLLYLFRRSSARVGRVVMLAGWSAISLACWLFDLLLFEQVLIQAGFIWLVRALYFRGTRFRAGIRRPRGGLLGHGQHRQPGRGAVEFLPAAVAVLLDSGPESQARRRGLSWPLRSRRVSIRAPRRARRCAQTFPTLTPEIIQ